MNIISFIICTAFGAFFMSSFIAAEYCNSYSLSMSYNGRYCPGEGTITLQLLSHQCRYICLQSTKCKAYNYNVTEGTCTRFTSPCPQAFPDSVMEFAVLAEIPRDQCYQWTPYSSGDPIDPRMISTGTIDLLICRMQRGGDDRVCHFYTVNEICYASWGASEFNNNQGYPCQRLRIMEVCTIFWVPYTARDPIHPRSVTAGHMANGDVVYVTNFYFNGKSLAGHYVRDAAFTTGPSIGAAQSSSTMMMMVVLWQWWHLHHASPKQVWIHLHVCKSNTC